MPLILGVVLHNRYRISRFLAQGQMGAVYQAWDTQAQKFCAIKEYYDASPAAQRWLETMYLQLAGITHPNLPRVTDFFADSGQGMYLVMDFVEGEDLGQKMQSAGGKLPESQVMPWIAQLCDALFCLHSQNPPIVHGDIKPENIKISPNGIVTLVDLGTIRVQMADEGPITEARKLNNPFAAPARLGDIVKGPQGDLYALAAMLYMALTGKMLPEKMEDQFTGLSRRATTVIEKAIRPGIEGRYASAADFKYALGSMAVPAGLPTVDLSARSEEVETHKPAAKFPLAWWIAGGLFVISLLVIVAAIFLAGRKEEQAALLPSATSVVEIVRSPTSTQPEPSVTQPPPATATLPEPSPTLPAATVTIPGASPTLPMPSATQPGPGPTLPQSSATPLEPGATPEQPLSPTVTPAVAAVTPLAIEGSYVLKGHQAAVNGVTYSLNGALLASGSEDGKVILWNAASGEIIRTLEAHSASVNAVAFSPDNTQLATGSADKTVALWKVETGEKLFTLEQHTKAINCLAFSPDGSVVVAAAQDNSLSVWNTQTGEQVDFMAASISQNLETGFTSLVFSSDGRLLYSGSVLGTAVWDAQRWFQAGLINGNAYSLAFSPDGKKLAMGSFTGGVTLWKMPAADYQASLYKHRKPVSDLLFALDGSILISSGEDGLIVLWNSRSGEIVRMLEGHTDSVNDLALSPDGKTLASASTDGTVILWALVP